MTTTRTRRYGLASHAAAISKFYPIWYTKEWCNLSDRDREYTQSEEDLLNDDQLPEGFIFLGAGVSRMAFLGPDGKVYKVPKYPRATHACETEANTWRSSAKAFEAKGVYLARSYWDARNKVLVMEHCPQARPYSRKEYEQIEKVTGLWDIHPGNAWVDVKGRLVIIDYAT